MELAATVKQPMFRFRYGVTPMITFLRCKAQVVLFLALCFCHVGASGAEFPHYEPSDTIVVLGAVPQEIPLITEALDNREKGSLWGIPYWKGELHGKPVVVAITGIGKTFTAMTTTMFIREFKPKAMLMTGTGARVNKDLRTGDVIVATSTHEHDYGSLTPEGMRYRPMNGPVDGNEVKNEFKPDSRMLAVAEKAMESYEPRTVEANGKTYRNSVSFGVVTSSDLFGVPRRRIELLRERFDADIMEMESAPLAHVCQTLGVPFLVVRAGSNIAQEDPGDAYLRLGPIAARQAAYFSRHLLQYL